MFHDRALGLVAAGIGVALMPALYKTAGVVSVGISDFNTKRTIGMRWLPQAEENKWLTAMIPFACSHPWITDLRSDEPTAVSVRTPKPDGHILQITSRPEAKIATRGAISISLRAAVAGSDSGSVSTNFSYGKKHPLGNQKGPPRGDPKWPAKFVRDEISAPATEILSFSTGNEDSVVARCSRTGTESAEPQSPGFLSCLHAHFCTLPRNDFRAAASLGRT
jgi:hypothetical protein